MRLDWLRKDQFMFGPNTERMEFRSDVLVIALAQLGSGIVTLATLGQIRPWWDAGACEWAMKRQLARRAKRRQQKEA